MRPSIILLIVCLALLSGCGSQSQTRTEFEADHPYAKPVMEVPAPDASYLTIVQYVDHVPAITPDGVYTVTKTTYTNGYDAQGVIRARGKTD